MPDTGITLHPHGLPVAELEQGILKVRAWEFEQRR